MTVQEIREQIPTLKERVYGRQLVYFDNAATSLRPQSVIDKWTEISSKKNANIHRAVHKLAVDATEEYESTRDAVKKFINAPSRENIVFTSGATASLNLVAYCFAEKFLAPGDEIIICEAEHHSNIVPWQIVCERKDASIKVLPVEDNGTIKTSSLDVLLTEKTRLLCVAHISNVLGIINPIKQIVAKCHEKGCAVLVDGAQGIVHGKVDVQDLDCDFYAFSGHKVYAAPGTGVLYAKAEWLEAFPPFFGGGEMIESVSFAHTTYAKAPGKFEAGTQNFAGVPTLKAAIKFAEELSVLDEEYDKLVAYLFRALTEDERIRLFGVPENPKDKTGIFSFSVIGVHHEDLALLLDKMGFALRSGQMCAEPLMDRFGVTGMLRLSVAPYNTIEEASEFIKALNRAINMLV